MEFGALVAQVPAGQYISIWKAVLLVLTLLAWARTLTWIDKDAPAAHLPRQAINVGLIATGVLGLLLFFVLPDFLVAYPALLFLLGLSIGVYLFMRNQRVGLGDLKQQFSDWITSFGKQGKVTVQAVPGQTLLYTKAGAPIAAPDAEAPERPAYDALQQVLTDPLRKDAERIEVTPMEGGADVRYLVDGVVYTGAALPKTAAAAAITNIKELAGLDVADRRKPQSGMFKVLLDGRRRELLLETRGSSAGESMSIVSDYKKRHAFRLEELGLAPDQLELIQGSIQRNAGIVLVSAPLAQGRTSTLYALIRAHDAFLSHIITVEREPDTDLEGIHQERLPRHATSAEEAQRVTWICSQIPDVVMIDEVHDANTAQELIRFAGTGHRVYVGMRAASTFDALTQWRKLVGDDRHGVKHLDLVLNSRVLRKLCSACKIGYAPDPQTLRKLNMDPMRVSKLYQARTEPLRDAKGNVVPCEFCHDLHFRGRTGIYEVLHMDDDIRMAIVSGASVNQLKVAFRQHRGKYLQEQALLLVEQGDTSIQEVLRVLKAGTEGQPPATGAGGVPPRRAPASPPA